MSFFYPFICLSPTYDIFLILNLKSIYLSLYLQLDSDGDGQLSLEEFKVLFDNAEKRKREQKCSIQKEIINTVDN